MKFSIITCTYNSAQYVQNNIDSVKNQTCQDFEHIFIDGFSIDDTVEIIEKYRQEFPTKVRFFQFSPKGISNAMNCGIEKSLGEYLIHLHSDDSFYDNDALQDVNDFIKEKNNPDWIYGKVNVVEENNTNIGIFPKYKLLQLNKNPLSSYILKFFSFIPHQSVFIKKIVLEKFGLFDETLRSSMDYDLWIKIRNKTNWAFLNKIISNYKIRPDAQSSGKKNRKENYRNLKKVQERYMNKIEFFLASIFDAILARINKTIR